MIAPEQRLDILLVEDDRHDAELMMRVLSRLAPAPSLVHVEDGERALDFLFGGGAFAGRDTALQPRLVLTDLDMPRMDGVELLKRLRADARTCALPVVVLGSMRADLNAMAACARNAANSYVVKPVDFEAFSRTLEDLCRYWLEVNVAPEGFLDP